MILSTSTIEALLCAAATSWADEIIVANPSHQPGWAVDQVPSRCAAVLGELWASGQRQQLQLVWTELVDDCARVAAAQGRVAPTGWDLVAGLRDVLPAGCDDWELARFLLSLVSSSARLEAA